MKPLVYYKKQNDVFLSVCLKCKISVTAEPIGSYSSGNIPTGLVVALGYFLVSKKSPGKQKFFL